MKRLDLLGKKFFNMRVVEYAFTKGNKAFWKCECDCGNLRFVRGSDLVKSKIKSCGCLNETIRKFFINKHGFSQSRIYWAWMGIKKRCNNPKSISFKYYGARGIKCLWKTFEEFYRDMGDRPKGMTIDRIDNDGHYCKENCRWATPAEQNKNKRPRIDYLNKKKIGFNK